MSRKLVFVSVFLAVLPVAVCCLNAQGADPPKEAKSAAKKAEAAPRQAAPGEADNPFGEDAAASAELKRLRKPAAPAKSQTAIKPQGDGQGPVLNHGGESWPRPARRGKGHPQGPATAGRSGVSRSARSRT